MLVLTRNVEETIVIGGVVKVTILSHRGGKIRLGINAPADITVDRLEVHEAKERASDDNTTDSEAESQIDE